MSYRLVYKLELIIFLTLVFVLAGGKFLFMWPLFILVLWLECGGKLGKLSVEWFYLPYQATLKAKLNLLDLGSVLRSYAMQNESLCMRAIGQGRAKSSPSPWASKQWTELELTPSMCALCIC